MFKIGFFKTPKNKPFTYTPIYYDPVAEDLKERIAKIEEEGSSNAPRIKRGSLRESWGRTNRVSQQNKQSNVRLLLITAVLLLICWIIFKGG